MALPTPSPTSSFAAPSITRPLTIKMMSFTSLLSTFTSPPFPSPTISSSLTRYLVPPTSWTSHFPLPTPNSTRSNNSRLVASTAIVHSSRILLLQRSLNSFQSGLWELPGGRCEASDPTIIAGAVRELFEETGLVASRVVSVVGEYGWLDKGREWWKVVFRVEVMGLGLGLGCGEEKAGGEGARHGCEVEEVDGKVEVKLDPNEHMNYIWATEEEVGCDKCGEVELRWTSMELKGVVLDAFRVMVENR